MGHGIRRQQSAPTHSRLAKPWRGSSAVACGTACDRAPVGRNWQLDVRIDSKPFESCWHIELFVRLLEMRYFFTSIFCLLIAGVSIAEGFRPDWHTGDYPGRNRAMWSVISEDLKT